MPRDFAFMFKWALMRATRTEARMPRRGALIAMQTLVQTTSVKQRCHAAVHPMRCNFLLFPHHSPICNRIAKRLRIHFEAGAD